MSSIRRGKGASDHNLKSEKSTKPLQVTVELCKDCEAFIEDDSKALICSNGYAQSALAFPMNYIMSCLIFGPVNIGKRRRKIK